MGFFMKNYVLFSFLLLVLVACGAQPPEPVFFETPSRHIDYLSEVKPLLDKRCVVCHSCYNSPCQLKLSSYDGVDRGASKKRVYDATRLTTMDPTRLFTDAQSTEQWRQKGFFSVTQNTASSGQNNSFMLQLLDHKMKHREVKGEFFAEDKDLTCAATHIELGGYLHKHPNRGMPFGFPPLTDKEFNIIAGWLTQGGKGPTRAEQEALQTPAMVDVPEIAKWEAFLNQEDAKHAMTARYLYEHLFLAQIRFQAHDYYELIRSSTPTGKDIELINTVRPYDDPGTPHFYYRFRKIYSTIVHKTHMVFTLDDQMLTRVQTLFIKPKWLQPPHLVGYEPELAANPFKSFAQIPPRSRYQFLLDNSHYVIMTFIRGPVCKGQVALNVIHDHFWIMFLDPDYDLSVRFPALLTLQEDNLRMPIEKGSDFTLKDYLWGDYQEKVVKYNHYRQDYYFTHYYNGLGYKAVWPGDRPDDAPLLTVYRHFDSASVLRGAVGRLPRTMWVIDYPLFERIYYALVAGFDVFGNVGHQLMVRKYMDDLRMEAESNFLEFMPPSERVSIMQSWNQGVELKSLHYYNSVMPAGVAFHQQDHKREFIENLVGHYFKTACGISFDKDNYLAAGQSYPPFPSIFKTKQDYIQGFQNAARPGSALVRFFTDHNANLAYVRIRVRPEDDRDDVVVSIVINRWHDNVAVLFSEDKNLDAAKDRADFVEGFVGSYPNYFFDVSLADLPEFLRMLARFDAENGDIALLSKFGVNRADADFWQEYDWFQQRFLVEHPIKGGLFDLNRYYFLAIAP